MKQTGLLASIVLILLLLMGSAAAFLFWYLAPTSSVNATLDTTTATTMTTTTAASKTSQQTSPEGKSDPPKRVYFDEPSLQAAVQYLVEMDCAEAYAVLAINTERVAAQLGLPKYNELAREFYEKAASKQEPFAVARLELDKARKDRKPIPHFPPGEGIKEDKKEPLLDWIKANLSQNPLIALVYGDGHSSGLLPIRKNFNLRAHEAAQFDRLAAQGFAQAKVFKYMTESNEVGLEELATQGYDLAMFDLAILLCISNEAAKVARGLEILGGLAEKGYAGAMYKIWQVNSAAGKKDKAVGYLRKAAKLGFVKACRELESI